MYNTYTPHYKRINMRIPSVISYLAIGNPDSVSNWDGTPIAVSHIECIVFIRWHIVCYSNYSTMSHIEIGTIIAICN